MAAAAATGGWYELIVVVVVARRGGDGQVVPIHFLPRHASIVVPPEKDYQN